MSRETQVILWCDGPHGAMVAADEVVTIGIDGNASRSVDLCADCIKEVIAPVRYLLDEFGVAVEKTKSAPKRRRGFDPKFEVECPTCGHKSPTRGSMSLHLHHKHKTTLEAVGL